MKLVWLLLVVALITPIRVEASQDLLPELVRRIKPSAVAIETYDARGEKLSRGSGFFIDADRIVTNRHVIEGAHRAEIHCITGAVLPVKGVLAVDAEGDIALLKIDPPTPQIRPLPLDKTSPQEGESVVVIGNPLGLEGSVTNGIVSAVRDIPTFGRIIQITAPISSGSSGSPVVNMQGQVIGIATLQVTGGQSVNFAIPSERISQLQATTLMSLPDLVAASGRNKRAKAVQFFRDGLSFLSKDDCEKALPYFDKATESDNQYAEAWAQSGFCNEKLGRHAEALEASKKAVNLRPSAESYFNIGLANFYLKQYKEAAEAYRQSIKLDPYNSADAYYALGLVYRDWGKADDEIYAYKQAIKLRPDYTGAYERLGSRYMKSKKFNEAVEVFRQLAALKPADAVAPNNLGEAYAELNRYNDACESFRQSIRLKPDYGRAYYNLGKCLLAMGNRDAALEQYTILTNIDPSWAEKLNAIINP
ncbi:MAG TPA: trypsin-like peptidase domain-containing protein [Pyrinomonadaceae bacterium]|jgi:tetratricopeptide (TPR) repeat protein|nr:trypsin-like peptidase domain-containing protein [Pyrinomonadaceae bacterium]